MTKAPLKIAFYDGEFSGDVGELAHLCDVEGCVTPYDRPPYHTLEEVLRMLDLCEERYSTPCPNSGAMTVFIGRKKGNEVSPVARLDVYAKDGYVSASVVGLGPRTDTTPTHFGPEDGAVTIARKVLAAYLQL
ncbi:hypothetical protein QFZ94_005024 [Paraburkholderia sp. JPY465]|uniref:hypothetical protein n=1 Tax=Paraburkholderia sp. JPY465 TaxID=3042285 RepID=UPI003D1E14B0